jgi:hypothetical protein
MRRLFFSSVLAACLAALALTVAAAAAPSRAQAAASLLLRSDFIYGSEIGCWCTNGYPAVNPATPIPALVKAAKIPVVRFAVYDVFTDMKRPSGKYGTIKRADFDKAISGIVNTLQAVPWIKLLPLSASSIGGEPVNEFVPPLSNLGRDLGIYKAVLAEVRKVYSGPIVIESDNEAQYSCYKVWGYASAGSAGVSKALGNKYIATMPALKKYARDTLKFSEVVTVANVGTSGGPQWGQSVVADSTQTYGYRATYQPLWVNEFNNAVKAGYLAHASDPDYIPDVESIHAYPHGADFSGVTGYEFDDNMAYAYYRTWLVKSRARLNAIWGSTIGSNIRFSISEWNAGNAESSSNLWSGWTTPSRVQQFYTGWLQMLQGDGNTTGTGTRFWNAGLFLIAGNPDTSVPGYYNFITKSGTARPWYDTFKAISLADPLR